MNPDYRINISENLVNGAINEHIVDQIELTPRSKQRNQLKKFNNLVLDILCGLLLQGDKRLRSHLIEFSSSGNKALMKKEFLNALQQLNVLPYNRDIQEEFFEIQAIIEGTKGKPASQIPIEKIEQTILDICSFDDKQLFDHLTLTICKELEANEVIVEEEMKRDDHTGTGYIGTDDFQRMLVGIFCPDLSPN